MFVKNILSTGAKAAQLARGAKAAVGAAAASANPATTSPANAPASDAMRQAVAGYDVTNISPRAYSEMLQKLRQANTLSEKDYQDLSSIRADLDRDGVNPDQPVNLVDLYTKKLAGIRGQSAAGQPTAAQQAAATSSQRQLDWLQKFARLHSGQVSTGLDTVA
jgi:hypothetical protein